MTPLLEAVLSVIDWRSALQYLSCVILVTCLPLTLVFKPPSQQSTRLHDHDLPSAAIPKLEMVNLNRDDKCYGEKEETSKPSNLKPQREELGSEQKSTSHSNYENQKEETSAFLEIKEDSKQHGELIPPLSPKYVKSQSEAGEEETTLNEYVAKNKTGSWGKYFALCKDHRHSCFFIGMLGSTVSIYFNGINLVSMCRMGDILL